MSNNICTKLNQGSFGMFRSKIDGLQLPENSLRLPRIIVVGAESSGKSALLTNLTKCEVFPSSLAYSTRCPVRLHLTQGPRSLSVRKGSDMWSFDSEAEVHRKVSELIGNIPDSELWSEEIEVHLQGPAMPDLELLDLPGLREFPESMRDASKALVARYLQDPNTLVLCVVPAATTRLTSSQAIGMVLEHKKQSQTLLALTMTDLVPAHHLEPLVAHRLLGVGEEMRDLSFHGCVALSNWTSCDEHALQDHDEYEDRFFTKRVFERLHTLAPSVSELKQSVGMAALLRNLDVLFDRFLVSTWYPQALQDVRILQQFTNEKLTELGPPLETLTWDTIEEVMTAPLAFESMTACQYFQLSEIIKQRFTRDVPNNVMGKMFLEFANLVDRSFNVGDMNGWNKQVMYEAKIDECQKWLNASLISESGHNIHKAIHKAWDIYASHLREDKVLHLYRFERLQSVMKRDFVAHMTRVAIEAKKRADAALEDCRWEYAPDIDMVPMDYLASLLRRGLGDFVKVLRSGNYVNTFFTVFDREYPPSDILEEDEKTAATRRDLEKSLQKVQEAIDFLSSQTPE
jgi:GTP-binding protein EngB required for normal cell division